MKGDFSRLNVGANKANCRVMMQQGRVLLDSDWNEQAALFQETIRQLARDIFGPHGGSKFDATPNTPDVLPGFGINSGFKISPGRYYVNGIMVETAEISYEEQIGYPFSDAAGNPGETKDKIQGRNWFGYLDVWEDYISSAQDELLTEIALGGPDTCGRARINWQVKIVTSEDAINVETWKNTGTGTLSVQTIPARPDELCVIEPDAKYHGIENQLYRVEIHRGGPMANAQYKWSRDNGSVVFPVLNATGSNVELMHLGKDKCSSLKENDWVEYVDDSLMAGRGAGVLARVARLERGDDNQNIVILHLDGENLPVFAKNKNPILRRWDQLGEVALFCKGAKNWTDVEDGIQIRFSETGEFRAGDYWLIPARTASGKIDWPDGGSAISPHGPMHYYAPLALMSGGILKDLRFATTMSRARLQP